LHRVITVPFNSREQTPQRSFPLSFSPFKAEIPQVIAVDVDSATSSTLWANSSMKGTKGGRKGYRNKSHQLDVIVRDKINCLAKLQVRVPWSN
jgi:hypothetical protein